jgi:hypothetical protein
MLDACRKAEVEAGREVMPTSAPASSAAAALKEKESVEEKL